MKRNSFFPAIMFLIIMHAVSCAGVPRIEFNELEYNFGIVSQDTELKHLFTFRNTGNSALQIRNIKPSCGCTGVLLKEKKIPAGGTGDLEVTFNTGTYEGLTKKTVYVYTNDKKNTEIKLTVAADILGKNDPRIPGWDH